VKKNIIIGVLSGISVLFLTFSLYQKSQADTCMERSVLMQTNAEKMLMESEIKNERALQQLATTNSQLAGVIQQLQIAQKN
jgi:predicted negative regulator of RcsB-dependent stress response